MLYKQSFYGGADRNRAICNFLNDVFGTEDLFIINSDYVYINGSSDVSIFGYTPSVNIQITNDTSSNLDEVIIDTDNEFFIIKRKNNVTGYNNGGKFVDGIMSKGFFFSKSKDGTIVRVAMGTSGINDGINTTLPPYNLYANITGETDTYFYNALNIAKMSEVPSYYNSNEFVLEPLKFGAIELKGLYACSTNRTNCDKTIEDAFGNKYMCIGTGIWMGIPKDFDTNASGRATMLMGGEPMTMSLNESEE